MYPTFSNSVPMCIQEKIPFMLKRKISATILLYYDIKTKKGTTSALSVNKINGVFM